ncbi:MAG TPA: D-arabinono-1,4-lactone oxidase [Ktedonobacterales bacterium]|jgi:FAD-linked oxidoreductase
MATGRTKSWRNWSGSVQGSPREIVRPGSINDLTKAVGAYGREGRQVRVVGAGHSFTPLVQTDDVLISLDQLQGIEAVDAEHQTVTVLGGTRLKTLGEALLAQGVAQENLGDIDVQSIAGAISTGTHGTGIRFGTLSTQVDSLTLVTSTGELLECSQDQNPEIFKAAQVSVGTLGVIAKVRLRVVPAKRLHFQSHREKLAECIANLDQYKQQNSHFEYFWLPYTEWVQAKFLNETDAPATGSNLWGKFNKVVLENGVYWMLSECCRLFPKLCKPISKFSATAIASVNEVDYSHRLYATPRLVRFQEMEYNIPAEHFKAVIAEIQECITRQQFAVHFPVECRFVHADDIWLSPAYQRESAYVAVHMYRGMPYQDYFQHIEAIFKRYHGRPHWGKMHTQTAETLAALYPRWHDFRRIRASLDPQGIFLNDYLRRLFGCL